MSEYKQAGVAMIVIVCQFDLQLSVVCLNPAHEQVYSIKYYGIKFVFDLITCTLDSSNYKADLHDTAQILLKVALNTTTPTPYLTIKHCTYVSDGS